ncbi:hypothetical protein TanjilG_28991 [Lupinus angustifolius]|uniref:HMA domain-containing protein n=1 Tax=Lupinus angustifolius TaxID=3871 RepID=A0A4P1RSN3_LUPAN|nr:hypothetical protein TanjilG_28991 [Lupinus angustifolius]
MGEGKEEKKDEKGKDKIEEKNKEEGEVINAIYKVNLHCQECGSKIKKHLMRSQGVQNVDIDIEKGEIKAKGKLDPLKILKLIEKKSNKKKVELISPKVKPKETITTTTNNKTKEMKDVHMHCDKCEADLKQKLMKHKGIFEVKTNMKTQNLMVNGTIEVEKLLSFMRKKVHKNAEVIYIKEEKKEEKKEKGKEEGKKKDDNKGGESTKEKEEKSSETSKEKEEGKSSETSKEKEEGKSSEKTKEKEEGKSSEKTKEKENVPYIIHYVYAPQIFSDENPNSCSIL